MFVGIAKIIWGLDIRPGLDENGKSVEPDTDPETGYSEGFLVCAKEFGCRIAARSEMRRETIMKEYEQARREVFSQFEDPI